jgi:hypothetical protein
MSHHDSLAVNFQLEEPVLLKKAEEIFRNGIAYSTGEEFLRIVPEFADVILVISDSNFPSSLVTNNTNEPINTKNNHEVLSCQCGVLGRHVIFYCEIKTDNGQITRFNIVICPTAQQNFIKSLQDTVMQQQRPLQLVLMGKHAYEFHLNNVKESCSIEEAGYNIKIQIKAHPQLMKNFVRCDDVDISAILFDYYQNLLYQEIFFDTFEAVKQYCPICSKKK